MATVEQRLMALEQLLAPRAAAPPITIGMLANVPAPGSPIASPWAQDISSMVVQRFATTAALKAWNAPTGAFARVALDTGVLWRRAAGAAWSCYTPRHMSAAGVALDGAQSAVAATVQVPADPGTQIAAVTWTGQIAKPPDSLVTVGITVAGTTVVEGRLNVHNAINGNVLSNVSIHAGNIALPVNTVVQVTVAIVVSPVPGAGTYQTFAGPLRNRLDVLTTPRGF